MSTEFEPSEAPDSAPQPAVPAPSQASAMAEASQWDPKLRELITAARAPSTQRAYVHDWRQFEAWCALRGVSSLPAAPETVAHYILALAEGEDGEALKPSSIARRRAAIAFAHEASCLQPPTAHPLVKYAVSAVSRQLGTAPSKKKAVTVDELLAMLATVGDTVAGARDRALLVVGFLGGFRRSELVALDVPDLEFEKRGVTITLRRSKTDQHGAGRQIALPNPGPDADDALSASAALSAWLRVGGIKSGPVFRPVTRGDRVREVRLTDQSVSLIVKRYAEAVGLDPSVVAGHSLRSGFITAAAEAGASEQKISEISGHRSVAVLRSYVQSANRFQNNAAGAVLTAARESARGLD